MNGKVQGIIICGVIAASLAGVMVLLNKTAPADEDDSSETSSSASTDSEDESVVILEKESSEIDSVFVKNTHGEYTLSEPASGKSTWTIDVLASVNQNTSLKESMLSNIGELEAKKLVEENAEDMSKYGLEEPEASFTVTYSDDSVVTVDIGTTAPDEKYSYVRIEGDNNVYMVLGTKLSYFTDPVESYVSTSLIAEPSDDDWPDYGVETITRQDWDYEVVFENDPQEIEGMVSSQVVSSPIFAYLNITNSTDATHGMWGLSATECAVVNPTDDDFKEYGLDDPYCTVSLKGDEYDYFLKIGNAVYATDTDGNDTDTVTGYYCYLTGVTGADCIYLISADSLPWASMEVEDVISTLMTTNYLVDLAEISVEYDDTKVVYDITTNGSSDETLEDGSSADVTKVECDGKELDIDNFKSLYQYIMTCPTNEIYFTEPESDCYMTITQSRKDGGADVIELYKDTSRRYIVKLNGRTSFRIQSTWIDTLLKNIESLQNGGEIDDNY
jgi:hypothetical protein